MRHMQIRSVLTTSLAIFSIFLAAQAFAENWLDPVRDTSWNNGLFYVDRFAAPSSHNMVSEREVLLDNGDVVVAGRVTYASPLDPSNEMWLGLVRYNAAGQRVAWGSGPDTAYTTFNRQYIIYPKGSGPRFTRVADIISYANFIYVLAEGAAAVGGSQRNVQVVVFSESNGEFKGIYNAFARSEDEYGAGLVAIDAGFNTRYLMAVGTKVSASGISRPTFRRFFLNATFGTLTDDNSIDPLNGGYRDLVFPDVFCNTGACSGSAYAVKSFGGGGSRLGIYVGGTLMPNNGFKEPLLLKVNADASLDNSFNGNGIKRVPGYAVTPQGTGSVYDIAVVPGSQADSSTDRIYALSSNDDLTSSVVKVRGDGATDPGFVSAGRNFLSSALQRARGLAVIGSKILVVGQWIDFDEQEDAAVSVVNADPSIPGSNSSVYIYPQPARRANGSRFGNSIFKDMVVRSGNRIVASGDVRDDSSGGTLMFGTLAITDDRIFNANFDSGDP